MNRNKNGLDDFSQLPRGATSERLCSALFWPKVFKEWICYTSSRIQELCLMLKNSLMYGRLQHCLSLPEYTVFFYCYPQEKENTEEYIEIFAIFSLVRIIINLVKSAFFLPSLFFYSNMSSFSKTVNSFKKRQCLTYMTPILICD